MDILAKLAQDAGRAFQENVRLYGVQQANAMHDDSFAAIKAVTDLLDAARTATCQCPRAHLDMHQYDCHLHKIPKALEPFEP